MKRGYKTMICGLLLPVVAGCATTLDNGLKAAGNGILIPGKVIRATVENFNPVQGLREGVVDTVEATGHLLANTDSGIMPDELGEINQYINERPFLKSIVDIGFAGGVAFGLGRGEFGLGGGKSIPRHINQAVGYATAGQAAIEAVNYATEE